MTDGGEAVTLEEPPTEAAPTEADEVVLALEYLEDIVDRRLEHAVEKVLLAARSDGSMRTEAFGSARADYAAAHIIASLVDERVYDANEWPVFTAWAAELMRAAELLGAPARHHVRQIEELERDGTRIKAQVGPAVMAVRIELAEKRGRSEERKRWTRRAAIWGIVCFFFVLSAFAVGWLVGALGG